ncbi:hypothetical protein B0I37DRAFT_150774 [Chaetomium sp. MPI-CAGE-AT-0009]|nr:hypothetical protein B0I37DRAFT_150774 [Chaetomium sp. MPI-CAGE-AT-0009]
MAPRQVSRCQCQAMRKGPWQLRRRHANHGRRHQVGASMRGKSLTIEEAIGEAAGGILGFPQNQPRETLHGNWRCEQKTRAADVKHKNLLSATITSRRRCACLVGGLKQANTPATNYGNALRTVLYLFEEAEEMRSAPTAPWSHEATRVAFAARPVDRCDATPGSAVKEQNRSHSEHCVGTVRLSRHGRTRTSAKSKMGHCSLAHSSIAATFKTIHASASRGIFGQCVICL